MVLDLRASAEERAFWERAEGELLRTLRHYAERASNGGGLQKRLFAEDAAQGFAFVDLCRKRYDVVLMNPPFGALSHASRVYVESRYERSKGDILAHFVERVLGMCVSQGSVGAITSRTCFFLPSLSRFREEVLGHDGFLHRMVDFGN